MNTTFLCPVCNTETEISVEEHKQKEIFNPINDRMVSVDEELADLLSLMWSIGIDTLNSCVENFPDITWIEISGTGGLRNFVMLAKEVFLEDSKDDITCITIPNITPNGNLFLTYSVRFKKSLLPKLTNIFNVALG